MVHAVATMDDVAALKGRFSSSLRIYSLKIKGKWTSVRLEPEFWDALELIAAQRDTTVENLCEEAATRAEGTLTSAIRVLVVRHFSEQSRSKGASDLARARQADFNDGICENPAMARVTAIVKTFNARHGDGGWLLDVHALAGGDFYVYLMQDFDKATGVGHLILTRFAVNTNEARRAVEHAIEVAAQRRAEMVAAAPNRIDKQTTNGL